jgi:hypothetical protein
VLLVSDGAPTLSPALELALSAPRRLAARIVTPRAPDGWLRGS